MDERTTVEQLDDIPDGAEVAYHGSLTKFHGQRFYAEWCEHPDCRDPETREHCGNYLLEGSGGTEIRHVRRRSITSITSMITD